jgi:hypothetical protein
MKKYLLSLACCFAVYFIYGQVDVDKSLSPYFIVNSASSAVEGFPLKATSAEVNIAGVIADVTVRQQYENAGDEPIEAIYVFPASTRAAVYGMEMKVGNRLIVAEIKEKQQARQIYTEAKSQGKRASLLEQERPNVFQMNVANIMPGDQVEVVLQYTELLIPEQGAYQFVYPTVTGPRFTDGTEQSNNAYTAMPYTASGQAPAYTFDLSIYLNGGMPIQYIQSATHKINIAKEPNGAANISLSPSEAAGGNRDFILDYSFEGNQIETGMLVYDDGEEQFFLCMAQPPKNVDPDYIPSREYIFVMDVSGSMNGFPLEVAKELMDNLVSQLRPNDRFNVLFFAGGSTLWSPSSKVASPENLRDALNFMQHVRGGGGTMLLPALKRAMNLPRQSADLSRSILIITDGYVSVEDEAFDLIRNNLNQANVFTFGIGSSVNRHLIEGMAHTGQGIPFIVTEKLAAFKEAEKFRAYIQHPVMTQITARFDGFDAYDIEPSSIPDVMSERPVILFGKFRGKAKGNVYLEGMSMQMSKKEGGIFGRRPKDNKPVAQQIRLEFSLKDAHKDKRNAALKYLWAREKIRNLADFNGYGMSKEDKQEVTRLGLKYNLLTSFTSFVAVEKERINVEAGKLRTVKQPLPLPQGVENSALGFQLSISGISNIEDLNAAYYTRILLAIMITVLLLLACLLFLKRKRGARVMLFIGALAFISSSCSDQGSARENPYQEVTFILGKDKSRKNPYYQNARAYFSASDEEYTPLVVDRCTTMLEVRNWLESHAPAQGAWKKVNLVAHGNEWTGINVPVKASGERCSRQELERSILSGEFKALADGVIDGQTQLNIFGCNVGKDSLLLKLMSLAFGGHDASRPVVSSARYFNVFENHGDSLSRHLAETYFVAFPAGSFPGNSVLERRFAKKYPESDIDWKAALLNLAPQEDKSPYVHYFGIPAEWGVAYRNEKQLPKLETATDTLRWVKSQADLLDQLQSMDLPVDSFHWQVKKTAYGRYPVLVAYGQSIIYCILKPLVDEEQQYVQASTDDPAYYTLVN